MRYHWGLGIGHTYSHSRNVDCQQLSADSPNEADGVEEEDHSDTPTEAIDISGGAAAEKPNEDDKCLQDSEPEDMGDADVDSAVSSDSDASTSNDGSSYDSDEDDEERLELYHTYQRKL